MAFRDAVREIPVISRLAIDQVDRDVQGAMLRLEVADASGASGRPQEILLDRPQWKPSTEEQAIARARRTGQVRTVQVHRLVKDCIDERICEIQQGKRLLFDEFARKSDAKDADRRAVDTSDHRPEVLDDESVPAERLARKHHRVA